MMEATERLFRKQQQMFADILPVGETDFGMDPSWVSIYPYQILLGPGERQRLEIRVRNYRPEPMKFEAARRDAGWAVSRADYGGGGGCEGRAGSL